MHRIAEAWMAIVTFLASITTLGTPPIGKQFLSTPLTFEFRIPPEPIGAVRAELIRMQEQDGLTIAWYDPHGPEIVEFDRRVILRGKSLGGQTAGVGTFSRDGTQIALQLGRPTQDPPLVLGIMKTDNSDLREYLNVARPGQMCWSNSMANIATLVVSKDGQAINLKVLDLESKSVRDIAPAGRITAQCWSPDGKGIVFESGGNVMIQNDDALKPRTLALGTGPTWSPDGNWIAYLDEHEHSYYIVHPSGEGKKKLFHNLHGMAGLYWSPDARMVAYVTEERGLLTPDTEAYRLKVRRLADSSEDWVTDGVDCCTNFQWVTSKALVALIESAQSR